MKLTRIETTTTEKLPGLVLCRLFTDEGLIGCGESYYIPSAVEAVLHDWMAPRLLGADALAVESHWRFLYERAASFGGKGAEMRALSAVDLALWDIKGKYFQTPVWQLCGGQVQDGVRVYHSIGYGRGHKPVPGGSWPGYGRVGQPEPLNDYWRMQEDPAGLAREIVAEGTRALKLWSFDPAAHQQDGCVYVHRSAIERGLQPFRAIREALGQDIELILDGHGFFQLPAAKRIAEAMIEIQPLCLEDLMRPDSLDSLRCLRESCQLPLAVSEMLIDWEDFRRVLDGRVADYVMIDPTWVGGISQTLRIVDLAQGYNMPVMMHDCTGPLTLLAGVHVGVARANVAWQETVRLHLRILYPDLLTGELDCHDGRLWPSGRPGLGVDWDPGLFADPAKVRVSTL